MVGDGIHYDYRQIDSYNRILNFIIGARGIGKTYGFKQKCIERFLQDKGQFIYMRRTPDELNTPKARELFWPTGLKTEYPQIELGYNPGGVYTISFGEGPITAGYALALSRAGKEKSIEYDLVKNVAFDEFIIEKQLYRYMPGETRNFQEAMVTICRDREDCKFYLLANAITWNNPYFVDYNIHPPKEGTEFVKGKNWVVHCASNQVFTEHMKKTKLGGLLDEIDTEYFDYAFQNQLLNDTNDFIKPKSKYALYTFTLIYNGKSMGVWHDLKTDEIFVTEKYDDGNYNKFVFTRQDFREGSQLLATKTPFIKSLIKHFQQGAVFFDKQMTKGIFYEWLKFVGY